MSFQSRMTARACRLGMWLVGTSLLFGGCDPTLRATAENGIISVSQGLLGSLLLALTELFQESNAATA